MNIKPIRTKKDYEQALARLEVIFDAKNSFHGCIPGIHEVLRRQGLLEGRWCLNPKEDLSNGQVEEIDRIYKQYPEFTDDEFVKRFLAEDKKTVAVRSK